MKISLEKILIGILIGILLFCVGKKMFMVEGVTGNDRILPLEICKEIDSSCGDQYLCLDTGANPNVCANISDKDECHQAGMTFCDDSSPPPPNIPPSPPSPPAPAPPAPPTPPTPPTPPAPPSTNPCDNLSYGSCQPTTDSDGHTGYCVNIKNKENGKYFCNGTIKDKDSCNNHVSGDFTWCNFKESPKGEHPPAPLTNPCNIADRIGRTYFKWNGGKIPGCRNDQCIRTDEQIKEHLKKDPTHPLSKRVCGPTNVWTDGVTCADNCDASLENLDMMNLCVLTDYCKKNPCEIKLIDADIMEQGNLVFKNYTDVSIYVVIDKTTQDYKKSKKPLFKNHSSFDHYDFYQVVPRGSITFGFTTWESGKAFIIPYLTETIRGGTFNGNGLGGLEWTVKRSDDRPGYIASGNLSAVDGINFNSKMKFYNVKCGDYNNRETNLNFTDRNFRKFRGLQNDRIPTYKSPLGRFVNDKCPDAVTDNCSGNWHKSDKCYFENIKNKWNCLDLMAKAEFNISHDHLSNDIRDWVKFISSVRDTDTRQHGNIYAWAYDEIQIQDPTKGPPECGGMPCALPTNHTGWKDSKHLKCISDELCGGECYGYVGNNIIRKPLIVCAEPSKDIPSVVFEITEIVR